MNAKRTYLIILFFLFYTIINSQNKSISSQDTLSIISMSGLDINGLLVDETQSKLGKEFYEMFFANWNVQEINYEYSLVFQEKPLPSFGAQITVLINDIVVFSQFVQPRYEKLEEMVSIALANAENYMQNYVQIQSELEYDEMKGTGIY